MKIIMDAAYTADAKERMKKYDRSLQDLDMETMANYIEPSVIKCK